MSQTKKNLIANTISKILRIVITLILIPLYIKYLGYEKYADWILLFALPSLFEISNFGINQAVNNTFSIYFNREIDESKKIISTGFYLTFLIGLGVVLLIYIVWNFIEPVKILNIETLSSINSKLILIILTCKIFVDMLKGILCSFFFAQNKHHVNVYIDLIQYFFESLIIIILVIAGSNLILISNIYIIPSITVCILLIIYNLKFNSFNIFSHFIEKKYIQLLIKPSYSFSLLTISEYLLNQGFIILFKKFFSSQELIIFNSTKTLVNYLKNVQGLVASSVLPVFNVYFGKNDLISLFKLYNKSHKLTVLISVLLSVILYLFGYTIWNLWIGGSVEFNNSLLAILIIIQIISSLWIIPSNLIVSINEHFYLSSLYLFSSILVILVTLISLNNFQINFYYIPGFYLIHQIIMLVYIKKWTSKFFKNNIYEKK